ncbi:outer envelope pore protein 16-3, chloroplastic/mitochondrial-like [Henckelia pumila]|uniref:outer envelope pore protein 16-3, chloroplastic/mitochondrial-like n=1 Tax=Henckelia pumila TaxID=405737 RepID=UPI003C6E165D
MEYRPILKTTMELATPGLANGIFCGSGFALMTLPLVEGGIGRCAIHSAKLMGRFGLIGAAVTATLAGVSLSLEKYRKKNDLINPAVGGFVTGAACFGYGYAANIIPKAIAGRSIPMVIAGGTLYAMMSPIYSYFNIKN